MKAEPSIDEVINHYTPTIYGVALSHTRTRADADDVFQEVTAAYWRAQPRLTSEEHRKAWLIRTTINQCHKLTQSSWARRTNYLDGEHDGGEQTLNSAFGSHPFAESKQQNLALALDALPQDQRTVVQLFYFEDLSISTIAQILEEREGTVKTRLSRARARLRETLKGGTDNE